MLIAKVKRLRHSDFARNVAIVAFGAAAAQAISIAYAPIVARLYGPEAIGVLSAFTALLGLVTPLTTLSYPFAIVLPKSERNAIALVKLAFATSLIAALIAAITVTAYNKPIAHLLGLEQQKSVLFLLPAAMVFGASVSISGQWVIRNRLYNIHAKIVVLHSLVINTLKLAIGYFIPSAVVLISLLVFGGLLQFLMLQFGIKKTQGNSKKVPIGVRVNARLAIDYKAFPLYRTPQNVLASINQGLPIILLASIYGPKFAGLYGMGRTVLFLPVTLLAKSVYDVIYPKINEAYQNGGNVYSVLLKSTQLLSILALPFLLMFLFFAPKLFPFVFGEAWYRAGEYARWMSIWFFFNLINRPSAASVPVLRLERMLLVNSMLNFVLCVSGFLAGYFFLSSDLAAVALYSLFGVVPQLVLIFSAHMAAKQSHQQRVVATA